MNGLVILRWYGADSETGLLYTVYFLLSPTSDLCSLYSTFHSYYFMLYNEVRSLDKEKANLSLV